MFGRWFQRAPPVEDRVWLDAAGRDRGLRAQVELALAAAPVLLLLRSRTDLADAARALAACSPVVADDRFAASDLQPQLTTPRALGLSTVDALRPLAAAGGRRTPLQVHVVARAARRTDDRRLLELLGPWAPARVVFHHALDDALLRPHAGALQPLLARLGLRPDEPIDSPLLGRAIARAQQP